MKGVERNEGNTSQTLGENTLVETYVAEEVKLLADEGRDLRCCVSGEGKKEKPQVRCGAFCNKRRNLKGKGPGHIHKRYPHTLELASVNDF